jgi:hypothetical protein
LAGTVCENLPWRAPNGQLRVEACLALLEQLAAAGTIQLPAKQARAGYRSAGLRGDPLPVREIVVRLGEMRPITVEPVPAAEQPSWDATMAKYHPLGFERAFGAHQRYWIRGELAGEAVILGALLFAAAARHVAVRDAWLGWTREQQQRLRYRIVANSRYLILPGVQVPHLASHALSLALRRLPDDWQARYGYRPVVVETFVAPPWRGTCYLAANWLHLGRTTGEGRQDRQYAEGGTVREVFVYPLQRDWRPALVAETLPPAGAEATEFGTQVEDPGGEDVITAEQKLNEMTEQRIKQRYETMAPYLNERQRRLFAAAEAVAYGSGGQTRVASLLHMSTATVARGMAELQDPEAPQMETVRKPGGGRKRAVEIDPTLQSDLEKLVDPATRGKPESPLLWTAKSAYKLSDQLNKLGHSTSEYLVRALLHEMGYSLLANRKTLEGSRSPDEREDRNAQFEHINERVKEFQAQDQPVISVDAKKKELIG